LAPVDLPQRLRGPLDRAADRIVHSRSGRSDNFGHPVHVLAHPRIVSGFQRVRKPTPPTATSAVDRGKQPALSTAATTGWRQLLAAELARVERSEEHTSELQSRENLVCR